jgi:hypothetical protein
MKKTVLILVFVFVMLAFGSVTFAVNPFIDVPAGHWSYEAVNELVAASVIDGYNGGKFNGDKTITRYEMAIIVAKAMAKEDKMNMEQKEIVNKLAAEYKTELEGFGIHAQASADKAKPDRISFSGIVSPRYDWVENIGTREEGVKLDLYTTLKINDEWSYRTENEIVRDLKTAGTETSDWTWEDMTLFLSESYLTGPVTGTQVKLGRFTVDTGYGMTYYGKVSGLQVQFGNSVKTTLITGKDYAGLQYNGLDIKYAINQSANMKGAYQKIGDVEYYEAGFDTQIVKNTTLTVYGAQSSNDSLNEAYHLQLIYGAAIPNMVNSSDFYIAYRKSPTNVTYATFGDYNLYNNAGFKGIRIGYDRTLGQNIMFNCFYQIGKTADDSVLADGSASVKYVRTQFVFFF